VRSCEALQSRVARHGFHSVSGTFLRICGIDGLTTARAFRRAGVMEPTSTSRSRDGALAIRRQQWRQTAAMSRALDARAAH